MTPITSLLLVPLVFHIPGLTLFATRVFDLMVRPKRLSRRLRDEMLSREDSGPAR